MASPFKKIRGKQITDNEITGAHLYTTGNTATNGQIPSYNSVNGGFTWISLSADTIQSVSGSTALTVTNPTGPNVLLSVRTDNQTIYTDSSNNLHLGDPANNNLITGSGFGFSNNVIIYGNLIVNGTATTVNSETVTIADNFILLNSNFTAGTPTQDAGIEISRGSEPNVFIRWNEQNDYFEISNPSTGLTLTYSPILTTASVNSGPQGTPDNTINIQQGTGINSDQLYLSVSPANFTNIPNSALTNSNITVVAGTGLGGGGTVALGGSITLSATPTNDFYVTGGTYNTLLGTLTLARQNGIVTVPGFFTGATVDANTFVTGFTYNTNNTLTIAQNGTAPLSVGINNFTGLTVNGPFSATTYLGLPVTPGVYVTGFTYNNAGLLTISQNSGNTFNATISNFTGLTVNGSFSATTYLGLPAGAAEIYVTGFTYNNAGLLTIIQNSGTTFNVTINNFTGLTVSGVFSATTYLGLPGEIYVTGGTTNGSSNGTPTATIGLLYNQGVAPGLYTLPFLDTKVTGGTVTNGTLVLTTNNSASTVTVGGVILQSLTAQQGLTATTSNGAVTVGIQPASVTNGMLQNNSFTVTNDNVVTANTTTVTLGGTLNVGLRDNSIDEIKLHVTGGTPTSGQYLTYDAGSLGFSWVSLPVGSVPVTNQKGLAVTATTSNNAWNTNILISVTPSNDGYVGVSINGVWYEVGNGVLTKDCYFSVDGGASARTIAAITAGDTLYWNGTNSGFNLDANDRIDLYYNA